MFKGDLTMMRHVTMTLLAAVVAFGVFMLHTVLTAGGSGPAREDAALMTAPDQARADWKPVEPGSGAVAADLQDGSEYKGELIQVPTRFEIDQAIMEYQAAAALYRECRTVREVLLDKDTKWDTLAADMHERDRLSRTGTTVIRRSALRRANAGLALADCVERIVARRSQLVPDLGKALTDDLARNDADYERMGILSDKRELDQLNVRLRAITDVLNREAELDAPVKFLKKE